MNILPLFSLPVLIDKYPNSFDDELKYLRSLSLRNKDQQQVGSTGFSQDNFILNNSKMKKVRVWIQEKINFYKIIGILLGFSGIVYLFSDNLLITKDNFFSALMILLGSTFYVIGGILTLKISHKKKWFGFISQYD